jgi:hypothetical protein
VQLLLDKVSSATEQAKERQQDARSFRALDSWWLDVKLGVRLVSIELWDSAASNPEPRILRDIRGLNEVMRSEQWISRMTAAAFVAITVSVLILSSGIYALMSFTVSQRRKEIGIRIALGADWKRIVTSIFSRSLLQLASGAALGAALGITLQKASRGVLIRWQRGGRGACCVARYLGGRLPGGPWPHTPQPPDRAD